MPALQVRDFPDELYEDLRVYAAQNHRSIAQQTIACVENELRRRKLRNPAADEGGSHANPTESSYDPAAELPIPAHVREAVLRAQSVDPFGWLALFHVELDEEREARHARWKALDSRFEQFDTRWIGPKPSAEDIVLTIRDSRDERTDAIIANAAM